jgi:tight adherence protein B
MTLLCLILVALAVLLFAAPSGDRRAAARLAEATPRPARRTSPRARWALGWLAGLVGLWFLNRLAGPSAAVLGVAALIIVATCVRLCLGYYEARTAARVEVEVAQACSMLASQIRVGRVPAEALHGAAQDCPVLSVASKAQDLGGDVTSVWRGQAALPGHEGLAALARGWQVSTETGAPLAHNLEQVAEALSAEVALRAVVRSELAAARATGKIMAVLPLFGLGMGYLLGGDPLRFLLSQHWGWACLVLGVALAAVGVLWIDKLAQPSRHQG